MRRSPLLLITLSIAGIAAAGADSAQVQVKALGANQVQGSLTLKPMGDGVHLEGELKGLAPNTTHGFHVHEKGDCSAADGSSAGGHWNPSNMPHGAVHDAKSHAGDLGNVQADAQGIAKVSVHKAGVKLEGYVGKSVIVHAQADDLKTQPTGNAGGRVACGVIQR